MQHDRFKELLEELDGNSLATLTEKNARYSSPDDALCNFKVGAEIMGTTQAGACWNYMAKHLADLRNKIERDDFSNREDFLEKCQDTINYIRFLWCIGNETDDVIKFDVEPEYKKRIDIYHKPDNELVKSFLGTDIDVEVFDDHFVILNTKHHYIYTFSDFYCVEHDIFNGTALTVRKIEK